MDDRWLDPKTLELLRGEPPQTVAPPTLPDYSLVLLEAGGDRKRMVRGVQRVVDCPDSDASRLLGGRLPLVVKADLSYHDAEFGQFEFICCDAITVIIASEVVTGAEPSYLKDLFARLRRSDEFRRVTLRLDSLPRSEDGTRYADQFLGLAEAEAEAQRFPVELRVFYKKARIMAHWGNRIGAQVRIWGQAGSRYQAGCHDRIE